MPAYRKKPAYLLHKATGQARVRIGGKDVYLGAYGSRESKDRYDELIEDWLARENPAHVALTVDDLCILFMEHAGEYYRKDGKPTTEVVALRHALRPLVALYGRLPARQFSPQKLIRVRDRLVEAGHVRTSINAHVHKIRRMFRWAVENEMVPGKVVHALDAVRPLRAGRSAAVEAEPVGPVDQAVIDATLPHLPSVVRAMVELQLLTGCRPGEVCSMRPKEVTLGLDGVWTYRPASHKTEHHGRERRIYLGPRAQEVVRQYMQRPPEAFCFSPAESEQQRRADRHTRRKTPIGCGNRPGTNRKPAPTRTAKDCYTRESYRRAICRACEAAFGMPAELQSIDRKLPPEKQAELRRQTGQWRAAHCWSPNQLRHTRATVLRKEYGIEAAKVVLGHSDVGVTQIYAEADFDKAAEIMAKIG